MSSIQVQGTDFLLATPAIPISPDPNSQTAGGIGTTAPIFAIPPEALKS